MDHLAFRCRLAYHLGLQLFHPGYQRCTFCSGTVDPFGDHALHCGSGRGVSHVSRHHRVRDTVHRLLAAVGYTVVSEPSLPYSSQQTGPSRADLLVQRWQDGADTYLDFVGVSPLTVTRLAVFEPGAAASTVAARKAAYYAPAVAAQEGRLRVEPFAFETLGGLDATAAAFLARLQDQYREARLLREGLMPYTVFTAVSFAIATGVGVCLAARLHDSHSSCFDVH